VTCFQSGTNQSLWRSISAGPPYNGRVRAAAFIAVLAGAMGSLGLMLRVGHGNRSFLLMVFFAIWVVAPFAALIRAWMVSVRWSAAARTTLYVLILGIVVGGLVVYGEIAFGPSRARPAFAFLVVPATSWLLIVAVLSVALFATRPARSNSEAAR